MDFFTEKDLFFRYEIWQFYVLKESWSYAEMYKIYQP